MKISKKTNQIIIDLRTVVKRNTEAIANKIKSLRISLYHDLKREPSMVEIHSLISDVLDYDQVIYYHNLTYLGRTLAKKIDTNTFLRLCKSNTSFRDTNYQKKYVNMKKTGRFKDAEFKKDPTGYIREKFPEMDCGISKENLSYLETICSFRSWITNLKKNYSKLEPFHQLKLWHEWRYLKQEAEAIIMQIPDRKFWTITCNSKSSYGRIIKILKGEKVFKKNAIKVTQKELLTKIDKLKNFHISIK